MMVLSALENNVNETQDSEISDLEILTDDPQEAARDFQSTRIPQGAACNFQT